MTRQRAIIRVISVVIAITFFWTNCVWAGEIQSLCRQTDLEMLAAQSLLKDAVGQMKMIYTGLAVHSKLLPLGIGTLRDIYTKKDQICATLKTLSESRPEIKAIIPDLEDLMCLVSNERDSEDRDAYYYFTKNGLCIRVASGKDVRDRMYVALGMIGEQVRHQFEDAGLCLEIWPVAPQTLRLINSFIEEFYSGAVIPVPEDVNVGRVKIAGKVGKDYAKYQRKNNPGTIEYGVTMVMGRPLTDGILAKIMEVQRVLREVLGGRFIGYDSYHMHSTVSSIIRGQDDPITELSYMKDGQRVDIDMKKAAEIIAAAKKYRIGFNRIRIGDRGEVVIVGESRGQELLGMRKRLIEEAHFSGRSYDQDVGVRSTIGYIEGFDRLTVAEKEALARRLNDKLEEIGDFGEQEIDSVKLIYYNHRSLRRVENEIELNLGERVPEERDLGAELLSRPIQPPGPGKSEGDERGGALKGLGFIEGRFYEYEGLHFADEMEVACNLRMSPDQRFYSRGNKSDELTKLLNDSLLFLEGVVRGSSVGDYLSMRLTHPDNGPFIVIRISPDLPINSARYAKYVKDRLERVEIILNERFVDILLENPRIVAVKAILAERLFHEFGHDNIGGNEQEEMDNEKEMIKRDLELYGQMKEHMIGEHSLKSKVDRYFKIKRPEFPSGFYFKVLEELSKLEPGARDARIDEFFEEKKYWGVGYFYKSEFRKKIEGLMGVKDIVEHQRHQDREYAERLAKSALRHMYNVLGVEGIDYKTLTQEQFNELFGVRPIVVGIEHGERFSEYISQYIASNGQGKTNLALAIEGAYCSPGAKPVVGIDERLLGLIVKDEHIEVYHTEGDYYKVKDSVLNDCRYDHVISRENLTAYFDEEKVKWYIGVDIKSLQIVITRARWHGNLFLNVARGTKNGVAYSQIAFGKMATATLLDKTNASFITYLGILSGGYMMAAGGRLSGGDIEGRSNFFLEDSKLVDYTNWYQIPNKTRSETTSVDDRVATKYGEEQQALEDKLQGWETMSQEEKGALRRAHPYFTISDTGELFCQERLVDIRDEIRDWATLPPERKEYLNKHYAIYVTCDEDGKELSADLLIGSNTMVIRNDILEEVLGEVQREYDGNGFRAYDDSRGERDERKPKLFWGVDRYGRTRIDAWNIARFFVDKWRESGTGSEYPARLVYVGDAPPSIRTVDRQVEFTNAYLEQMNKPSEFVLDVELNENEREVFSNIENNRPDIATDFLTQIHPSLYRRTIVNLLIKGYMLDKQHLVISVLEQVDAREIPMLKAINKTAIVQFIDRGWITGEALGHGRVSGYIRSRDEYICKRYTEIQKFTIALGSIMSALGIPANLYGCTANLLRLYGGEEEMLKTALIGAKGSLGIEIGDIVGGLFFNQDLNRMREIHEKIAENRGKRRRRAICFGGGTGLRVTLEAVSEDYYTVSVQCSIDNGGSTFKIVFNMFMRRFGRIPAPGDISNSLFSFAEDDKRRDLTDDTGRVVEEQGRIVVRVEKDGKTIAVGSVKDFTELVYLLLNRILMDESIKKTPEFPFFAATMFNLAGISERVYFDTGLVPRDGASIRNMLQIAAANYCGVYGPTKEEIRIQGNEVRGTKEQGEVALDTRDKLERFQMALRLLGSMAGIYDAEVNVSHTDPGTVYAVYEKNVLLIEYAKGKYDYVVVPKECGKYSSVSLKNGQIVEIERQDNHRFSFKIKDTNGKELKLEVIEEDGKVEKTYLQMEARKFRVACDGTGRYWDDQISEGDRYRFFTYGDGLRISIQSRFVVGQTCITENPNYSKIIAYGLVNKESEGYTECDFYDKRNNPNPTDRYIKECRPDPKRMLDGNKDLLRSISRGNGTEAIVFGPGSVLTSILPHFMVRGFIDAIVNFRKRTGRPVIFIANPYIDNETVGYDMEGLVDFLDRFIRQYSNNQYGFGDVFTDVVMNCFDIDILEDYMKAQNRLNEQLSVDRCVETIMNAPELIDELGLNTIKLMIGEFLELIQTVDKFIKDGQPLGIDFNDELAVDIYINEIKKNKELADKLNLDNRLNTAVVRWIIDKVCRGELRVEDMPVINREIWVLRNVDMVKRFLLEKLEVLMSKTEEKVKADIRADKGKASKEAKKPRGRIRPNTAELQTRYESVNFREVRSLIGLEYRRAREAGAIPELVVGFNERYLQVAIMDILRKRSERVVPDVSENFMERPIFREAIENLPGIEEAVHDAVSQPIGRAEEEVINMVRDYYRDVIEEVRSEHFVSPPSQSLYIPEGDFGKLKLYMVPPRADGFKGLLFVSHHFWQYFYSKRDGQGNPCVYVPNVLFGKLDEDAKIYLAGIILQQLLMLNGTSYSDAKRIKNEFYRKKEKPEFVFKEGEATRKFLSTYRGELSEPISLWDKAFSGLPIEESQEFNLSLRRPNKEIMNFSVRIPQEKWLERDHSLRNIVFRYLNVFIYNRLVSFGAVEALINIKDKNKEELREECPYTMDLIEDIQERFNAEWDKDMHKEYPIRPYAMLKRYLEIVYDATFTLTYVDGLPQQPQPQIPQTVLNKKGVALGVDINDKSIKIAAVINGAIESQREFPWPKPLKKITDGREFIKIVADKIRDFATDFAFKDNIESVGVSIGTAVYNGRPTGKSYIVEGIEENIEEIKNIGVRLTQVLALPVYVVNDANAGAFCVANDCAALKPSKTMLVLQMGTGLGGAVVRKGVLLDYLAEVGNLVVNMGSEALRHPITNMIGSIRPYLTTSGIRQPGGLAEKAGLLLTDGDIETAFWNLLDSPQQKDRAESVLQIMGNWLAEKSVESYNLYGVEGEGGVKEIDITLMGELAMSERFVKVKEIAERVLAHKYKDLKIRLHWEREGLDWVNAKGAAYYSLHQHQIRQPTQPPQPALPAEASAQPSQITREQREDKGEELLCTLTIDGEGNIVAREETEIGTRSLKLKALYKEDELRNVLKWLERSYGVGIFKVVKNIYIHDNYTGLRRGEKGPVAEFKDGNIYIDIDAFRNQYLLVDPVEHEMLTSVLDLITDNEGLKEVTAVYRNVKRFLNPEVVDVKAYQEGVLGILESPNNGLDPASSPGDIGDYAKMLRRLLELQSRGLLKDGEQRERRVISEVVRYVLTTKRYEYLRDRLGIGDEELWLQAVRQVEEQMEAVLDVYDSLIRAKYGEGTPGSEERVVSDRIRAKVKETEGLTLKVIRTFRGVKIEGIDKLEKRLAGIIAMLVKVASKMYELRAQLNEVKTDKKYCIIVDSASIPTEMRDKWRKEKEVLEGYKNSRGEQLFKIVGTLDEAHREGYSGKEIVCLLDILNPENTKRDLPRDILYFTGPYLRSSLYMAAMVGIAGGNVQGLNPLVRGLMEDLFKQILPNGEVSDTDLWNLFNAPWLILPHIQSVLGNLDNIRKALAEIEKAA